MKVIILKDENNSGKYTEILYEDNEIISITNDLTSLELVETQKERLKNELVKKPIRIE